MNNLKNLRKEKGESQLTVAEAIGLTRSAYCNYENGLREPDFNTLQKLSEYFGVSIDYILGNTDVRTVLPSETPLTDGEKALLDLFKRVPQEQQALVLEMIKVALQTSK